MAKKILKKALTGREVKRSESGKYRTTTTDSGTSTRRTAKGFFTGATPVKETEANRNEYMASTKKANYREADRAAERYLTNTGGRNIEQATNIHKTIANRPITIPKDIKKYGDYKKGGVIKKTITSKKKK